MKMEIKVLETRIEKKELQIAKIEKKIAKFEAKLSVEEIAIAKLPTWKEFREAVKGRSFEDIYDMEDLSRAYDELKDSNLTLAKYKNKLQLEVAKKETTKISVIVDFLNAWAKSVEEFIINDVNTNLVEYYRLSNECCEFYNNYWSIVRNGKMTREEADKKYKELDIAKKIARKNVHPISWLVYSRNTEGLVNHEELSKILEKEKEARYFNLVEKVTKITGEIVDAKSLYIGLDGNLNGTIIGKDGSANIQTIGAGGYNIQCYHYRVLVHKA